MPIGGLATIPWLSAIVTSLVAILRGIYDLVVKSAKQAAAWAALVIPWVARQASRHIANRLLIVGVWFALLTAAWRLVISLAGLITQAAIPWTQMAVESNVFVSWLWDDPFNANMFFTTVLPAALGAQTTAASLRLAFSRISWAFLAKPTTGS